MTITMIWACSKADASMVYHPQVQVQVSKYQLDSNFKSCQFGGHC